MVQFQSCSHFSNHVLIRGGIAVLSIVVLMLSANNSFAETKVWVGNTDANMSTGENWLGGAAPVSGDAWEFGAVGDSGYTLTNNDFDYGFYNSGITFTQQATGSYTIASHWTKQTGDIVNYSSYSQTVNLGHELHDNITINAVNGNVNILQNNTINLNNHNLTVDGAHNTTIELQINHGGSLIKNGTGTLILNRAAYTNTPFTGNVTINAGALKVSGTGSLGKYDASKTVTINNGATLTFSSHDVLGYAGTKTSVQIVVNGGTITNENGSFNTFNAVTLKNGGKIVDNNGHFKWTSYQLVGTFNVTADSKLNADQISTISIGTAGQYNGVIPNGANFNVANVTQDDSTDFLISDCLTNGNGTDVTGSLTKSGSGTMTISGANTYTGTTTVSGGTLNMTGSKFNSRLIIGNGAAAVIDAGENGVVNMDANGYGNSVMIGNGSTGTLIINSGNITVRNTTDHDYKGSIQLGTNGNGKGVLTINGGSMQVDGRILMGANANAIEGTLNINGGSLTLGVPGSYTTETDPSCGVLWFGYNKNTVNLNGGTIALYGIRHNVPNAASSFNFNGGTLQAVANNNADFFPVAGSMKYFVKQGGAIIDTQGYNVTVGAKLEQGTGENDDQGGFTKLGTGTLTLLQAPAYTGATTVSAGTLKLSEGSTLYNLSGGSLDANGQIAVAVTLDSTGKALTLSSSDITKFIGSISASSITKTGDGTMQIYTGAAGKIDAQSLLVSSGHMDIKGYMTGSITVDADSVFSPGNSVGEATFGGGFILNEGATLLIEQDATGIDKLTASSYNIDPKSVLDLTFESVQPGATYPIIVKSSGAFDGGYENASFWNDLLSEGSAYYWNLTVNGDTVYATLDANAVPEPSTWALMALGVVVLFLRKRVRS
ncbi:MAG: autotransporter-associated beta strand repeat-containing protein [Thermoguttaceae bacterium]|nr:autotransporter-associated beta strand repeat-containing protein [Thermoguttaceae bacterium]